MFDAYGTLLDVHGAMARHAGALPPGWERISAEWRAKQLEYTWVRSLTGPGQHRDFWQVTRDALDYVAARHRFGSADMLDRLMAEYRRLPAYPDAEETLQALRAGGVRTAILSNGEPSMLAEAVDAARLGGLLDVVLSVEDVGVYKPDLRVYGLPCRALGLEPGQMGLVSSNAWDAQAAGVAGYRVFWCNRAGAPDEYGLQASATVLQDLSALPALAR